jgi:hypothetical protein
VYEFNETLVALRTPLLIHFVYPYERKVMRVVSGRSKPMRVRHCTGILGFRALMDGILF